MTGFVVERHGYTSAATLMAAVVTDLIANGFTLQYNSGSGTSFNAAQATAPFMVTLEAGPTVDPLNTGPNAQPWRIMIDVQANQSAFIYLGSPVQLDTTGVRPVMSTLVYTDNNVGMPTGFGLMENIPGGTAPVGQVQKVSLAPFDIAGAVGAQVGSRFLTPSFFTTGSPNSAAYDAPGLIDNLGIYTAPHHVKAVSSGAQQAPNENGPPLCYQDETTKGFIQRSRRVTFTDSTGTVVDQGYAFPLSYRLVLSPRGLWLGCWEDATTQETSVNFNWILVQRPVDRTTGLVLTTGKCPVFCVNSVGNLIWQFVVRENDILKPGKRRPADTDTEDSETILNTMDQVSLSEDGKYIVTFPSRLNTSRYRYPHELDMIGVTSADVVSQFTDVPLTVYSEAQPRTYKALQANGDSNTGMRLLVLAQGGGIS